jgi:hypothetical protein
MIDLSQGGDLEMAHRRAGRRIDETTVRRLGARSLRLLSLMLSYEIALDIAGKADETLSTPLAVLTLLAAIVASMLVGELADQLERREWP